MTRRPQAAEDAQASTWIKLQIPQIKLWEYISHFRTLLYVEFSGSCIAWYSVDRKNNLLFTLKILKMYFTIKVINIFALRLKRSLLG